MSMKKYTFNASATIEFAYALIDKAGLTIRNNPKDQQDIFVDIEETDTGIDITMKHISGQGLTMSIHGECWSVMKL